MDDARQGIEEQGTGDIMHAGSTMDSAAPSGRGPRDVATARKVAHPEGGRRELEPELAAFVDDLARLAVAAYLRGHLPRGYGAGSQPTDLNVGERATAPEPRTVEILEGAGAVPGAVTEAECGGLRLKITSDGPGELSRLSIAINEQHK